MPRLPRIGRRSGSSQETGAAPIPFVVGLTRSGTTLLRMMLDAHPELAVPPETHFVPDLIKTARAEEATAEQLAAAITGNRTWGDFGITEAELLEAFNSIEQIDDGQAVRTFFEMYAAKQGKPRWGEKTPAYMLSIKRIGTTIPEARFIHLIRDGRDVALSQTDRAINEQPPPADQAARWVKRIRKARDQGADIGSERYLEARYEDLVREPEETLKRICAFIKLPFDEQMLRYYEGAAERLAEMGGELRAEEGHAAQPAGYRIDNHKPTTKPPDPSKLDKWRREMAPEDLRAYESVAGEMLTELGYELGSDLAESRGA